MNKATVLKSVTAVVGGGGRGIHQAAGRDLAHNQRADIDSGEPCGDWCAGASADV